jgi:uncharacterized protein YtpQ (UPF0354 family)
MRFLIVFTALVLCVGAARADLLSPRAFTDAFAAAATAALPAAKVTVAGDLHIETRGPSGKDTTTDLRNAYDVYRADYSRLDEIIHDYVGVLVESVRYGETVQPLDRSRIVPVLKSQRWVEGVQRGTSPQAPQLLTEPYNTELTVVYAEDLPNSVRYLNTRDDVGDRTQLRNLALGNLHRILTKIEMRPGLDGTWLIAADGNYDASLLLADQVWSSGQLKVDGDIVAGVPIRGALFVTGSHNHTGLARMRAVAAQLAAGPYGLSSELFIRRDGKFVKFDGN